MTWMLWGAGAAAIVALGCAFGAGTHFGEITGADYFKAKWDREVE
jgi:hypothetical protein